MTARLPSLNGLRAFEAAARHLSFTQAASELNVTQTAISHQIRRLEEELGLRLFIRKNRALVDFKNGDVDAAIRYGRGHWPGLRAEWLMADEVFPVCSPALLSGKRQLKTPDDLRDHVLLHTTNNYDDWRQWLTAAGLPSDISKQPGITFDLILLMVQAAIDG